MDEEEARLPFPPTSDEAWAEAWRHLSPAAQLAELHRHPRRCAEVLKRLGLPIPTADA